MNTSLVSNDLVEHLHLQFDLPGIISHLFEEEKVVSFQFLSCTCLCDPCAAADGKLHYSVYSSNTLPTIYPFDASIVCVSQGYEERSRMCV